MIIIIQPFLINAANRTALRTAPVAQLDRVFGYEPKGRAFESLRVRQEFFIRAHRLAVRTSPFHGGNRGSIPRGRANF